MHKIALTSSMQTNLLSLKRTSSLLDKTEERLATGLKVNSAIDNASSYYTAKSLINRAGDLCSLLDAMSQGIQTIKAANEGIESATNLLEQMTSVVEQTINQAPVVTHQAKVELTELTSLEGYTAVNSISELNAALADTSVDKILIASDINYAGTITVARDGVTINGGGHNLTIKLLQTSAVDTTFENMQITTTDTSNYFAKGIYNTTTGANMTVRNVEIVMDNMIGEPRGFDIRHSATLENINIKISGDNVGVLTGVFAYTPKQININELTVDLSSNANISGAGIVSNYDKVNVDNIGVSGVGNAKIYGMVGKIDGIASSPAHQAHNIDTIYNGKANTKAIIDQIGNKAYAAYATSQFCMQTDKSDQGEWYLPAIGELMDLYGYNMDEMTGVWNSSGAKGDNLAIVNKALEDLVAAGGNAAKLGNNYYWSSTEYGSIDDWVLRMSDGSRNYINKGNSLYIRAFQLFENSFNPSTLSGAPRGIGEATPKVGDIMLSDGSCIEAADYDAATSPKAIGVVVWTSDDGKSAKIMSLKDLKVSSDGVFEPNDPFGSNPTTTRWAYDGAQSENITALQDLYGIDLALALNDNLPVVTIEKLNAEFGDISAEGYNQQYNEILKQYDKLVNDSSYQGINLLKGDALRLTFNESRASQYMVQGCDVSNSGLKMTMADWSKAKDVLNTMTELKNAVSQLRSYATELGNSYSIIQTRQGFTEKLINLLQEGADDLTLADMDEEGANMLALQTRQQLGINSLSLASIAAQSVLKLF